MNLINLPHFEIDSREVADWLDKQGPACWWTVDGDPLLMGMISLPRPGDDLADKFRQINKPLIIVDPKERVESTGGRKQASDLDSLAYHDETTDERLFRFGWKTSRSGDSDWLLIEDKEVARLYREMMDSDKKETHRAV